MLDALRMPYKNKREKLATIEEERILVQSMYERFVDVFRQLRKYHMKRIVKKEIMLRLS